MNVAQTERQRREIVQAERQRRDSALALLAAQVEDTDTLVIMRQGKKLKVLQFHVDQTRTEITELVALAFDIPTQGSSMIGDAWDLFVAIHAIRSVGYDRVVIGDSESRNEQVYRTFYRTPVHKLAV